MSNSGPWAKFAPQPNYIWSTMSYPLRAGPPLLLGWGARPTHHISWWRKCTYLLLDFVPVLNFGTLGFSVWRTCFTGWLKKDHVVSFTHYNCIILRFFSNVLMWSFCPDGFFSSFSNVNLLYSKWERQQQQGFATCAAADHEWANSFNTKTEYQLIIKVYWTTGCVCVQ